MGGRVQRILLGACLGGFVLDMFATATMRPRGFTLSRSLAWLNILNYHVVWFAYSKDPELKHLYEIRTAISKLLQEQEFAWAWLVIPREGSFSRKARATVGSDDTREIGIALEDVNPKEVVSASSHWGQRMTRFIRWLR